MTHPTTKPIRVLVVDDSAVVRKALADALAQDPEIEVVGTASDPYVAREKILQLKPDVLTLDIEMPRMDGLTFLRILQQHYPLPVVVVSSLTQTGSEAALAALEAGAVDVLGKPGSAWSIGNLGPQLIQRVKAAAQARIRPAPPPSSSGPARGISRLTGISSTPVHPWHVILIGASTGGTEAIREILTRLPAGLPPILIVQHIPPVFSKAFADRLSQCCAFPVREAAQNDALRPGSALVAPGDYHMYLTQTAGQLRIRLDQAPPLHHTRPAVDHLFRSAATAVGRHITAVLLTGMGSDGAEGMLAIKRAGGITIAQNEETCVVFGMPRAAIKLGAVDHVLPLSQIPEAILKAVAQPRVPGGGGATTPAAKPACEPAQNV